MAVLNGVPKGNLVTNIREYFRELFGELSVRKVMQAGWQTDQTIRQKDPIAGNYHPV